MTIAPHDGDTITVTYDDGRRHTAILCATDTRYDTTRYARDICKADIEPRYVTRWTILAADKADRRDSCKGYSWPTSDHATITPVADLEPDLFDFAGVSL